MSAEILWKTGKILLLFIVGAIISGLVVGKVKQVQIDAGKVELAKKHQELTVCQDANATNQVTIGSMREEVKTIQKSCTTRLREKENTTTEIKRIDSLRSGVTANETIRNIGGSGDDPILASLNGMFIADTRPANNKN